MRFSASLVKLWLRPDWCSGLCLCLCLLGALALQLIAADPDSREERERQIEELFKKSAVVDGNVNYTSPSTIGQPDFSGVKEITGINFGAITLSKEESLVAQAAALDGGRYRGAKLILGAKDIDTALRRNDYGVLLYSQIHFPLEGDVGNLQRWYDKGLRILMLQYGSTDGNQSESERLGGGTDQEGGLTDLGRRVVDELIRLGIVIDLSHCNPQTTIEAAEIARKSGVPVTANHVASRGVKDDRKRLLADYSRNITDEELDVIKATDGVVGIMAYPPYLRRFGRGESTRNATVDDFVAHLDYVVKRIGVGHVGISTDGYLDGSHVRNRSADGILDSPGRWKAVAVRLLELGYTEEDLKKILGLNFLRVYRKVLD